MIDPRISDKMRADWDARAKEDAYYYVAFGGRGQSDDEFSGTAADVVRRLESELGRLPAVANRRAWRALDIGCGPGRVMRPMSKHFGEIHGVDVSAEMIALARERLGGIPHAHAHVGDGATLAQFADDSFDFVYSYAVFQHIPSRDVVFSYLNEARRVLKPGGILRCQVNGLPETAPRYDTWHGVRIRSEELREFARESGLQLLALEGVSTQYMWITARKRTAPCSRGPASAHIRRITNAHSSEPAVPAGGRFACISLWIESLPPDADLNSLTVSIGGAAGAGAYLGPPGPDGLQQVNVVMPPDVKTGLLPVEVFWLGQALSEPRMLRVIPPPPLIPHIVSVRDGINLSPGAGIVSRLVKVNFEELAHPEEVSAMVSQYQVGKLDYFCTDPLPPSYELDFTLPEQCGAGLHFLRLRAGRREFAPVQLEVSASHSAS